MTNETTPPDGLEQVIATLQQPVTIPQGLAGRARRLQRRRLIQRGVLLGILALAVAGGLTIRDRKGEDGITFAIHAPGSRSVSLVGDFTDWRTDRVRLTPTASGEWRVALKLPPGRYRFAYLVDNVEWRADSRAARTTDEFGRPTSIIAVTAQ
jgi:hypothetical protein